MCLHGQLVGYYGGYYYVPTTCYVPVQYQVPLYQYWYPVYYPAYYWGAPACPCGCC
jgi:hypothetical protein